MAADYHNMLAMTIDDEDGGEYVGMYHHAGEDFFQLRDMDKDVGRYGMPWTTWVKLATAILEEDIRRRCAGEQS